jgi:hypothetical protein
VFTVLAALIFLVLMGSSLSAADGDLPISAVSGESTAPVSVSGEPVPVDDAPDIMAALLLETRVSQLTDPDLETEGYRRDRTLLAEDDEDWIHRNDIENEPGFFLGEEDIPGDPVEESKRWSSFLPLMGHLAEEQGIQLPLPFGISGAVTLLNREVEVKDIDVTINGSPRNLSDVVSVDTDNTVAAGVLRFDTFILPFLNVYVLGGYIQNTADIDLTLTIPPLIPGNPPRVVNIDLETDLDGLAYGGGLNLAGGYGPYFLTIDANYSGAKVSGGQIDQDIAIWMYSTRTGWRGDVGNAVANIWLGLMYWDSERELDGSIDLGDGETMDYEVLQGPKEPWNLLIGSNWELSREMQLVVEYGFNFEDLNMMVFSFIYRF